MPSLEYDLVKKIILDNNIKFNTFIETGTYKGETISIMSPLFKTLHTIEISKKLYNKAKLNLKSYDNINLHLGDSINVLNNLILGIDDNIILFLDGHWSMGITGKGEKDVPLIEELNIITKKLKGNAIIIIDDARLFGKGPNNSDIKVDWEDITLDNILKIVEDRLENYYFLPSKLDNKDRLVIKLKKNKL